jgi:hypothetical protein
METSSNHLCELLQPCCLQKISKSVVAEILIMIINVMFFSIVIETIALVIFGIIKYFYPSFGTCDIEETCTIPIQNANEVPKPSNVSKSSVAPKSKISDIFATSATISNYDFNF